jgi:hypothetical protein
LVHNLSSFIISSDEDDFDASLAFSSIGHNIPDSPLGTVSFQGSFAAMAELAAMQTTIDTQAATIAAQATQFAAMQAQLATLLAALPAAPAAAPTLNDAQLGVIANAMAAAAASSSSSSTSSYDRHAKDLDKSKEFTGEETPQVYIEDWWKNIKSDFKMFGTPDDKKAALASKKLAGKAAVNYNGFINAAGNAGCRETTTFSEFENWILTGPLSINRDIESAKLVKEFDSLRQSGSNEAFAKRFALCTARIWNNPVAKKLYTMDGMIASFLKKSAYHVQEHLMDKTFSSLEEVYAAAAKRDNMWFANHQGKNSRPAPSTAPPSPFHSRSPTPSLPFRASTPLPPPQLNAILAAIYGLAPDDLQVAALSLPTAASSPAGLNAMGKEHDHSVAPGAPIPKMTPDIEAWCRKNNACYRCRVKNAQHRSAQCPRFAGLPDRRSLASLDSHLTIESEQENGQ